MILSVLELKYILSGKFSFEEFLKEVESGPIKTILIVTILTVPLTWVRKVESFKILQTVGVLAILLFVAIISAIYIY
jgi:amino acid permease